LLGRWLAQPHVERWWNHQTSADAVESDFGAAVDGVDPADIFIAAAGAQPIGLLQRYRFGDHPGYRDDLAAVLEVPDGALSIDYFVGEPSVLRQGFGSAMIGAAVASIWRDCPAAPSIVVPVSAANAASWRTLERAGFTRVAGGPLAPDNPIDSPDHFIYRIERGDAASANATGPSSTPSR
jgi:aminoglycoside 6'-N-acetyltransferase